MFIWFFIINTMLWAELDPSTAILLRGSQSSPDKSGLSSGRYKMTKKKIKKQTVGKDGVIQTEEEVVEVDDLPAIPDDGVSSSLIENQMPEEEVSTPPLQPVKTKVTQVEKEEDDDRSFIFKASSGINYIDSRSLFWFREYNLHSPYVEIEANVWLSETINTHFRYLTTLNSSVKDGADLTSRAAASYFEYEFGVKGMFTRFGNWEGSMGLAYKSSIFDVTTTSESRWDWSSSGLAILLRLDESRILKSSVFYEVGVIPLLQHSETSEILDIVSGTQPNGSEVYISRGQLVRVGDDTNFFYQLGASYQTIHFTGESTATDPLLGKTLKGVGVGVTRIHLGFGIQFMD